MQTSVGSRLGDAPYLCRRIEATERVLSLEVCGGRVTPAIWL